MSDGYSETAKTFWKGMRKQIEKAVARARPYSLVIHTPLTPWVRVAKYGDPQTVEQVTISVLRPGQPLPGEQAIAVTLATGEVVVLGSIREESDDEVVLVTSPLVWRRFLADTDPIKLEWLTGGLVKVTEGVLAANGVGFYNHVNTSTFSSASATSVATPGVNFLLGKAGTYTLTARVSVAASNSVAATAVNMRVRIAGNDGTELPFILTTGSDVTMNNIHRITGYVYDGVSNVNVAAMVRTAAGTFSTKGSVTQLIAERTA